MLSNVAVICAMLSGLLASVCTVSNGMSNGIAGVCVMSDGAVCVMCRGASRVCVMSAAMRSGVCVPSAVVTSMCSIWYCMGHWRGFSKLQNDIYSIVLAPQVTVKIQRISQDLLRNIGMKYLKLYDI